MTTKSHGMFALITSLSFAVACLVPASASAQTDPASLVSSSGSNLSAARASETKTSFWNQNLNLNLTNIHKVAGQNNFTQDVAGEPWPGIGPDGEVPGTRKLAYSRIPAMTITDDKKLVVMFDLRWNSPNDQDRIDPGIAISSDGGHTWTKKTAFTTEGTGKKRRHMDATLLSNPVDGSLYVMHGKWADGGINWAQAVVPYYKRDIWAATIHKSTDGGLTWTLADQWSRTSHPEDLERTKVTLSNGEQAGVKAFLGGVGSGLVMHDGTLVFPIQTTHAGDTNRPIKIATTILYSQDLGKTWTFPKIDEALAVNQSSLENMVFQLGDKLVMNGRESNGEVKKRWSYISADLGQSWQEYKGAELQHSTTAAPSQGSTIYVMLPNGRRVALVSKPNGNGNDSYSRGNLALWVMDALNPEHQHQVAIIRPGSGNAKGAGYSSLAYKEGNLFIAYEDDGDIRVQNLTKFIPEIEAKSLEWQLPDEMKTEVATLRSLPNLNQGQKDTLVSKLETANENAIAISKVLDGVMGQLVADKAKASEQTKKHPTAAPSKQRKLGETLAYVDKVTNPNDTTMLDYQAAVALQGTVQAQIAQLGTKISLAPYVGALALSQPYDFDLAAADTVSVKVTTDSKLQQRQVDLNLGTSLVGQGLTYKGAIFARYVNQGNYLVGAQVGISQANHSAIAFARYRKESQTLDAPHYQTESGTPVNLDFSNVDVGVNYQHSLSLGQAKVTHELAGYYSYTPESQLDEDVKLSDRKTLALNAGIKLAVDLGLADLVVHPQVALVKTLGRVEQVNDAEHYADFSDTDLVAQASAGFEKRLGKFSLGALVTVKDYKLKLSTNYSLKAEYKF